MAPLAACIGALLLATLVLATGARAVEAAAAVAFPAPAGSQWSIVSGYNTATHNVPDGNDPYAIDIVRTDADTAGTQVLAPFDGRIRFSDSSCLSITDAADTTALICHVFPAAGLRGRTVTRGQWIATVAPAGEANNNGLAHIHFALRGTARAPLPFAAAYAIEGVSLPASTAANAYAGTAFVSSNTPALAVDAGGDLQVRPGAPVTLVATVTGSGGLPVNYAWRQTSGAGVTLVAQGATASFTAPTANGRTVRFEVAAITADAHTASATVAVRTSTNAPASPRPGVAGTLAAEPVFGARGLALAVYNGGSVAQLESAARAAGAAGAWVQDADGGYLLLILDGPGFVNDGFRARFAGGFATATALTLTR